MYEFRDALRAGLRGLFDVRLWLQLAGAALSLAAIARAIGAIVAALLAAGLMLMLPSLLHWLPPFLLAAWLTPLVMRRAGAIIARRVIAARPGALRMAPRPLPSAGTYRTWWLPLILCEVALPRLFEWMNWARSDIALILALFALAAVAPGPFVRSVLAPWFAVAEIDRALAARRGFWAIVALTYALSLGMLQGLAIVLAAWTGLGRLVEAIQGGSLDEIASVVLMQCAIAFAAFLAFGIFCTSALTWFAATALAGPDVCAPGTAVKPGGAPDTRPAPAETPVPVAPEKAELSAEARAALRREWAGVLVARPTPTRPAAPAALPKPPPSPPSPPSPERVKAAKALARRQGVFVVVLGLTALILARDAVVPWFLGTQFRDAIDRHGDWLDLGVRQQVRIDMACGGRTQTLRVLSWVGVQGGRQTAELACAAAHGQLDTVEMLVALGGDVNFATIATGSAPQAAPQTPLQQAVRTPAGLPVAAWLLAHGARPDGAAQAAAAANCLPCLAWLNQHEVTLASTAPATPLALWLDNAAQQDRDDIGALPQLIELGLSPTAVGADGRSALHAAATTANRAAIALLLAQGADPALADADGMKPVFYAGVALKAPNQKAGADDQARRARRVAAVLQLMAATPSLAGEAVPAHPRRPLLASDPYISHPYDFGMTAALDPAIRAAAANAGKPIHYNDATFLQSLPGPQARDLLARMDNRDIARVMPPGGDLTRFVAEAGWWPELLRAVQGWAPSASPAASHADYRYRPDCDVLRLATLGAGDVTPGASASWAVVDAWLDVGMQPVECNAWTGRVPENVARRPRAQQVDWTARTALASGTRHP